MRWRALAIISLGVNVILAVAFLFSERHFIRRSAELASRLGFVSEPKTNIVVRRQFFSWQEVESPEYETYIANLRAINCPEQTIRDIIIADVNSLFARRMATELVTPQQQWWRSSPDTNVVQVALEKAHALEDERRALLTKLLGPNWETGDLVSLPRPSHPGIVLDGPVLGNLSADVKQTLEDISAKSSDRLQAYLEAVRHEGKEPDPAMLAKLRQQTRDELAHVLPPGQLEDFLLRYSQEANNLRADFGQLAYFNPTPDEFRAVFRATDTIDQQIQSLSPSDPGYAQARKALEDQREAAIKIALGPKRYAEYQALHDPLYRDAVAQANAAGTPDAAGTIYAVNQAAAAEQASITNDTTLTDSQKAVALKRLELDQLQANTVATGQPLPPEPAPTPPPRRMYTLGPGDTAVVVSMIYGVPVSALQAANPAIDINNIRPGDTVYIPRNPLAPRAPP
jgi:hypothetical protein